MRRGLNLGVLSLYLLLLTAAGGTAFIVGGGRWSEERAQRMKDVEKYRNALLTVREQRLLRPELDEEIQSFVDRTLGGDLQTVDSELRRRLNRLVGDLGLERPQVNTAASPRARASPARTAFRRSGEERKLRDEIDFVEVQGTVSGRGTLEQIVQLLESIEQTPWLHRVDAIRLDPNQNGEHMQISLTLTTMFLPGRSPETAPPTHTVRAAISVEYVGLITHNPFRVPPQPTPPPPSPSEATLQPAAAPAFDYSAWRVTAVVEGPGGDEVWLRKADSGDSQRLQSGERLNEVVFENVEGEAAIFTFKGDIFSVKVGESLIIVPDR